jgi:ubiquinone/menaquinone biosynthesis C-methylase UbiE
VAQEYARHILPEFQPAARALCAMLDLGPGDRVADIACGPGTGSLAAAELGVAAVVGVDYAVGMLRAARELVAARTGLGFVAGDAVALPLRSRHFSVVISSFGVIFAPDPVPAVRELARILVDRGRLGILAWVPGGSLQRYYAMTARYLGGPDSPRDAYAWGDPRSAAGWLEPAFDSLAFHHLDVPFTAPSPQAGWQILRTATGRVAAGYGALDRASREALDEEMHRFLGGFSDAAGRVHWPREAVAICGRKSPTGAPKPG